MKNLLLFVLFSMALIGCKKEDIDKDGCSLKIVNKTSETVSYTLKFGIDNTVIEAGSVKPGETVWHDVQCRERDSNPDPSYSTYVIQTNSGKSYRSNLTNTTPTLFTIKIDW